MKYESMMRFIMDAAVDAHKEYRDTVTPDQIGDAVRSRIERFSEEFCCHDAFPGRQLVFDGGQTIALDQIKRSPNAGRVYVNRLIRRRDGLAMTVTIVRETGMHAPKFSDIQASGLLRIRTNHRVLSYRSHRLVNPKAELFETQFVEGDGKGGHKKVPPFIIGDLTGTDQALRYLLSCWAMTGRRAEHSSAPMAPLLDEHLLTLGQALFPPRDNQLTILREWPTDEMLSLALQLGPEYVSDRQVA